MDAGRREASAAGMLRAMIGGPEIEVAHARSAERGGSMSGRARGAGDVEDRVRRIVVRLAKQGDAAALPADADVYRRLGIASASALELLLTLEEELGVQLSDAEFNEARTIRALCALVERRAA
jgi:acyl carrier protein